jgi:hypothetical protein
MEKCLNAPLLSRNRFRYFEGFEACLHLHDSTFYALFLSREPDFLLGHVGIASHFDSTLSCTGLPN